VIRSYSNAEIAPAGCGGLVAGGMVFVNSGSATSGDVYIFDPVTDDLITHMPTTHLGTDPHGMVLVRNRYLWMANRGIGDNIVIWDVRTQQLVGTIDDIGAAPDLMDVSPDGSLVFVTLRGPKPLTGGAPAIGVSPGMAVIQVDSNGAGGHRIAFIPIGSQAPDSDADPHGIAVRWP
jgi:DNA-binding beta-propeller fold protein YncE